MQADICNDEICKLKFSNGVVNNVCVLSDAIQTVTHKKVEYAA